MSEFTSDDGTKLNYIVRGIGPLAVFFLHGMGGDLSSWHRLWSAIDATRFKMVALDFRGHGQSERKPSTFTNERLARDVLQMADVIGCVRFVVVGHSSGGKVGLKLAAMAQDRVAGLLLVGSVGPGVVPLEPEMIEPLLSRADDLRFVRDTFRSWFTVWPRAEVDQWLWNFAQTSKWALRAACQAALWTDITAETTGLTAPALIVAGQHDPVYGPSYQRAAVLPTIPFAKIVTVDTGHGLMVERPDEIAVHCHNFLNELT